MIYDVLSAAQDYPLRGERFRRAFAFLADCLASPPPPGRYEIDGDDVYANVMRYGTAAPAAAAPAEAHRDYIDLHCVFSGREDVYCGLLPRMAQAAPYQKEEDTALYTGPLTPCRLENGLFLMLFPGDAHRPGGACEGGPGEVWKAVVKIRCT